MVAEGRVRKQEEMVIGTPRAGSSVIAPHTIGPSAYFHEIFRVRPAQLPRPSAELKLSS